MSTFSCPVVQIGEHRKHPNADSLRVTEVLGSTCLFKEGSFETGDFAVFIPIDAVVPLNNPAFSFLADKSRPGKVTHRVKAKKLRGVFSDGFLVPMSALKLELALEGGVYGDEEGEIGLGDDMSLELGVIKYEEPEPLFMNTGSEKDPGYMPVYDMESYKKYRHILREGQDVVVTEKIHGCNGRMVYRDGRLWVGSHRTIKTPDETNLWWRVAKKYDLENQLAKVPDIAIYGEVYGQVQDLKYDVQPNEIRFAAFDAYDTVKKRWLNFEEFHVLCLNTLAIPTVPILYRGPYSHDEVLAEVEPAEGQPALKSAIANCIREGVVIRPTEECWNKETGRTIFKFVSEAYHLRKDGSEHH